jgi:hypothetical protein
MEPDYGKMDPEERTNHILATLSLVLGLLSLCAGLIPIFGLVVSFAGIGLGIFGQRSESKKIAAIGIAISVLGVIVSLVYAYMLFLQQP